MKNQKGVSLLMVFFIMVVMLSVVLGLGAILFNESKNIKSTEESLVAFFVADTGVEKTLYFSRKVIPSNPPGVTNGVCSICEFCDDCQDCQSTGEDCNFCRKCQITYKTTLSDKTFEILANIFPNGTFYNLDISSKGFYKKTSRAIGLQIANKDLSSSSPVIENMLAVRTGNLVTISANITDADSTIDPLTVYAHIRDSNDLADPDITTVWLELIEGDGSITYDGIWSGEPGYFFVYIRACDSLGNCGESIKFPITDQ